MIKLIASSRENGLKTNESMNSLPAVICNISKESR
jgi:hypothetical protein